MTPESALPAGERLESWKEIAAYLKRDPRTVQRWEKHEGLPVHRDGNGRLANVCALKPELDAWWNKRYRPEEGPSRSWVQARLRWVVAGAVLLAVLAGLAFWRFRGAAGKAVGGVPGSLTPAVALRRIWAGVQFSNTLGGPSLDGRYLSFGTYQIGLRDLSTGQERFLTPMVRYADSTFSVPSPDGSAVVYNWRKPDGSQLLRLVEKDGAAARVLYDEPGVETVRPFQFSSDGQWILAGLTLPGGLYQIALISSTDGSKRVLRALPLSSNPGPAGLSPDSRYVVYERQSDLWVFPVSAGAGSGESQNGDSPLIQHPARETLIGWAPRGRRVVFTSDRSGTTDVWMIAVTGGRADGEPEQVARGVEWIRPMGFTRQGALYYATHDSRTAELYLGRLDPLTGKVLSPPTPVNPRFPASSFDGDWSPDGRSIAYQAARPDRRFLIRSLQNGEERELPGIVPIGLGLRWSPDGRSLLVLGLDNAGRRGVHRVNALTGRPLLLAGTEAPQEPLHAILKVQQASWWRDGKRILMIRVQEKAKTSQIVLWDPHPDQAGGREKELHAVHFPAAHDLMDLSPDGKHLAFGLKQNSTRPVVLMVMPAEGGAPRELLRLTWPRFIASLTWMRDGRHLWLSLRDAEEHKRGEGWWQRLWKISVEGGEPQPTELALRSIRDLRVHPDGEQILFRSGGSRAAVWTMENFLPAAGPD